MLEAVQIVCRALGIWGVYLIAIAAGLDVWASLLAAAIFSLGAMIAGPSVLTFEYEPTPRAFAVPMLFCAMGLVSQRSYIWAGAVAGAAFLIHAPTTIPFWIGLLWISRRETRATTPVWVALLCAAVGLAIAAHLQPGGGEKQQFFSRLMPQDEAVQRMRTAYNWISIWWRSLLPQYFVLYGLGIVAYVRVKRYLPPELRAFSIILPAIGMLSMPLSYLLLEQLKWSLVPQLQPLRTLLFVTAFTVILGSVAGLRARHILESAAWFALVFYIPTRVQLFDPVSWRLLLTVIGLGAFAATALRLPRPALLIAGLLAFFAIPWIGGVVNYPNLHTPEIAELSRWARYNTSPESEFLFPDEGHRVESGIFRFNASRAVYVDWKSGGQVNYLKDFAEEWRKRWGLVNSIGYGADSVQRYRMLGVNYLVLQPDHRLRSLQPVYQNSRYAVYRISDLNIGTNGTGKLAASVL